MKILLLGDYSNYHATLGAALAAGGHEVTVASDGGGWMRTAATLSLRRRIPGPGGGALLFTRMMLDRRLRGYDVVSLINPSFVTLRPARLRKVYDMLERHNGRIYLGGIGTDKAVMDYLTSPSCSLRYCEYSTSGRPNDNTAARLQSDMEWSRGELGDWCAEVYERCHGITSALYEYHLAYQYAGLGHKLHYTGIPVDLDAVSPIDHELCIGGKLKFFLGRHAGRMDFKGTDRIGRAVERVVRDFPDRCSLRIVEDMPYARYVRTMRDADVVLDQLYSYTPATNALLAMAAGMATVSGGEREYYDFIGEHRMHPIINVVPDDDKIYEVLARCVLNPEIVIEAGRMGREFVTRHNAAPVVAQRHLEFWQS